MTPPRKRTSGFDKPANEELVVETTAPEEVIESSEDTQTQVQVASEPTPFVEEKIVPTPDLGPRFVEEVVPVPEPLPPAKKPVLQPPPKRHPRNVPRFSRLR